MAGSGRALRSQTGGVKCHALQENPDALREGLQPRPRVPLQQATTANTLAAQWMERSLDDSAVRRMDLPEMFLLADAIVGSLDNITDGMVIYPKVIASRVQEQLPFMCAENIIMKLCAQSIPRQEAHEQIRVLSHQAARVVKLEGKPNDLIERIKTTEFPAYLG